MNANRWATWIASLLVALAAVPHAFAQQRTLPKDLAFTFTDQHGAIFTDADLRAKPSMIHFGYTSCPVICPTTLYEVASRLHDLGDDAARINFIFVTVDPERDTPSYLGTYIDSFDRRIIGLSGSATATAALAAALGAHFSRVDGANGDYAIDHSVTGFLVDAQGAISELYTGADSRESVVMRKLRELAASNPRAVANSGGEAARLELK